MVLPALIVLPRPAALAADAAAPATRPAEAKLDPPYVDGSFGFTVAPPAGGAVYRQKHVLGNADVEIVQFANLQDRWSLTVRLTTTTQPLDTTTIVEGITANIAEKFKDVRVVDTREARIDNRDGVLYSATFSADGEQWLRQQAVIRSKPTEFFGLVFVTPIQDRQRASEIFEKIVASFHMLRSEAVEKRIQAGLARGRRLLRSVADGDVKLSERLIPERYLRFMLDGKEVGFVEIRERARTEGKHPATQPQPSLRGRAGAGPLHHEIATVEMHEWAWLFKPDGTTTHLRHDMSLADDLAAERWENRILTILPAQEGRPKSVMYELETGFRNGDQLLVAYMPQPNAAETHDKVIEVDSSYASAAWYSLLPRIIDPKTPELYAFASYNADRRGLALRTIEVVGKTELALHGALMAAFKMEDSEGLIPPRNEIDVDAKGQILRVLAGPLEMLPTTREEVEHTYTARVKEAQEFLSRQQIREPVPAKREHAPAPAAPSLPRPEKR